MATDTGFRFPPGDSRTAIIGATGTGKTTAAAWLLSHARFDKRPWVVLDYKGEELFEDLGAPPLSRLKVGKLPGKRSRGVYLCSVRPGENDIVEEMLWRMWERGNVGLFVDEAALLPRREAFQAILRQGRSKRIPVIACSQRPVDVEREVFSEASFFGIFRLQDKRDYKVVEGFVPSDLFPWKLPPFYWRWYDVARNNLLTLAPVPDKSALIDRLAEQIPFTWNPLWT